MYGHPLPGLSPSPFPLWKGDLYSYPSPVAPPPELGQWWQESCLRPGPDRCRNKRLALQFLQLVDIHFRTEHSVTFYAGQMHICRAYLRQVCQKALEYNPAFCIGWRAALEAASLLLSEADAPSAKWRTGSGTNARPILPGHSKNI